MSNHSVSSDEHEYILLQKISSGNEDSFAEFVQIYQARLRAFVHSFSDQVNEHPDDLSQDILLQIYLSARSFNGRSLVSTWVFAIARNIISNKRRKKKLLYFWKPEVNHTSELLSSNIDGEALLQQSQNRTLIRKALMLISYRNREVLALFEFSGLSYENIAEILKVSIGTVKSRLYNAREELAKRVSDIENGSGSR